MFIEKLIFTELPDEVAHFWWNPEIRCRVHNSSSSGPVLSYLNPQEKFEYRPDIYAQCQCSIKAFQLIFSTYSFSPICIVHARFSSVPLFNVSVNKQLAANNKVEYARSQFITRQNYHTTVALSAFYPSQLSVSVLRPRNKSRGSIVSPGLWLPLQRTFLQWCSNSVHSDVGSDKLHKWQAFWAGWHRPEESVTVGRKRETFDRRYNPLIRTSFHDLTIVMIYTRWFKYDRDRCRQIYTQTVPVIFKPPCVKVFIFLTVQQST